MTPTKVLLPLAATLYTTANAAIINLTAGENRTDDPVTGVDDWTLDAGLNLESLPSATGRVIFEAGGDGTGVALVLSGSSLVVYQDRGDFIVSSPVDDSSFNLDITSFSGSVISIRLDADLSGATDTLTLTATDGSSALAASVILPGDVASIAGGNDTGFGLTVADLAGLDESPEMAVFNAGTFKNTGANVLSPADLQGNLYTLTDQPPASIPDPGSWGLVPEPGSTMLLSIAILTGAMRRRRS